MRIHTLFLTLAQLLCAYLSFGFNPDGEQLWLITAKISHNTTYKRDTTLSLLESSLKWENEYHQSARETSGGTISAVVKNQAENQVQDFLYTTESGEAPLSLVVTGNGSKSESLNKRETIDGVLVSADIRTDEVSGTAYPNATLYFEYSADNKSFEVGISIKAVGSYNGRMYSGGKGFGEWKDYGGDYKNYGLSCTGGGDALTDKNCTLTKTGKGYQGSWKKTETKKLKTSNGLAFTTSETTIEITVEPYKASDKPEVTLIGCTDLEVGGESMLVASGKPFGGTFRFWVEPSSMMSVDNDGSSANLTGMSPERGTIYVEYTTPDGKTAQTSQPASCVKVESYNEGQPIPKIGLFDIDGRKKSGILTVPVDAQPANAAELVKFVPADPGVLTAVGTGNEVTLQGIAPGKTTLQAKTKCNENTGPVVDVEVANCDDETLATLERMKKVAMENLVEATEQLQKTAGSPEFEKARDELVSSTRELLAKAALTIIANGKSPTTAIKVAAEIADKGAALSEIIASSNPEEIKDNIGKTASGDSFEKIVEKQFGEKVGDLWGKSLSAAIGVVEVQQAAKKFGDIIGEILKHEDELEALDKNYESALRNLESITKRQQFCKSGTKPPQPIEPQKPDPTPKPKDPTPPKEPTPKTEPTKGEQPNPTEPTPPKPPSDDEPPGDPEPPVVPPKQVGLPYEPADCGCGKTKDLTIKSADFAALGVGIKNLGECVEDFKTTSLNDYQLALQEMSALTDSLSTSLKTNAEAFLVKAKASKPRLDELITRVKSYDKAGTEFLNKMEKCPESVTTGMEIFQSVEKITIDSIKTKY